jgi:hypothetical protein
MYDKLFRVIVWIQELVDAKIANKWVTNSHSQSYFAQISTKLYTV